MGHVDLLKMNLHLCPCIHSKVGDSHTRTVIPVNRKGDFLRPDWCCKQARNIQLYSEVSSFPFSTRSFGLDSCTLIPGARERRSNVRLTSEAILGAEFAQTSVASRKLRDNRRGWFKRLLGCSYLSRS